MTCNAAARVLCALLLLALWARPAVVAAAPGDADNDTISDVQEGAPLQDTDGDSTPDYLDSDSDGDGVPDAIEAGDSDLATPPVDSDGDKLPDFRDVDSDNDGVPDAVEDADGDGVQDPGETDPKSGDSDGDGLADGAEDKNGDGERDPGECNPLRPDTDGDGVGDAQDACCDEVEDKDGIADGDGCPEQDADDDGLLDGLEQGHKCLDPEDADSDDDGLLDGQEDLNKNGVVDLGEPDPCNPDTDGDGFPDGKDKCPLHKEDSGELGIKDGCPENMTPTDGGMSPPDSDGDGLSDTLESLGCTDPQLPDTDGDGASDGAEDANHNGVVDPGETDPCRADLRPMGGAGCVVGAAHAPWPVALLLLLLPLLWRSRRD